ncbi:MAG: protein archease, partial [Chloroflexi bacterium CG07_land_8_20_14_0_80_51_10]
MQNFEIIDHTADVGIVAYGDSVEEVFINAAYGMFSL